MREHAAGDKQHTCEICNKQFQNINNLKQHALIHTGNAIKVSFHPPPHRKYLVDIIKIDVGIATCVAKNVVTFPTTCFVLDGFLSPNA